MTSEAPRGKPRGNLLRRSSIGYAGRVFAEPCEARNAIVSSIVTLATEDPPCGKPQGFLAKKGDLAGCDIIFHYEIRHQGKH
ncbi:MAG: hypothetical protein KJ964_07915 [Verrucomicrobia bacterium]|nr:hypothetical protein [Verrucomicrobiota bacterium]MBU1733736.1 hypothetical protein [Verrucomicrobiota bacterium]MBU1855423.1 hypothetical protein [Verrucomicrobiota bacterium]